MYDGPFQSGSTCGTLRKLSKLGGRGAEEGGGVAGRTVLVDEGVLVGRAADITGEPAERDRDQNEWLRRRQ